MANRVVQAVYDLKDSITGKLRTISDALRANTKVSDQTTASVERNNRRQSDSYKKTADSLSGLRSALAAVGTFVGLSKVKDGIEAVIATGERLDDLSKEFANVFGGLDVGAAALEKVRAIAQGVPQGFEDVAAAAIKLRQAGFDPLDGSLQALLDNQNALNQSQDELLATIDALGKANIKGEVSLKSLVSLTQLGIPVFDLLGASMGVSADRARQLANEGKLTGDSIKGLVGELGKLRSGVGADELGDTDAQLQKLKDSATEFLNTIAHSGALDFFREELKTLNDEVNAAAKDGRLQALAKSISDGIVATGQVIKGVTGFVVEYSGALLTLAKTYVVFQGLKFAGTILDGAAALEKSAIAAAIAAKAAGESAGTFGKLGAAVRGIPATIKIAVAAAAIEFTLNAAIKLGDALDGLREANRDLADKQAELAEGAEKLARKIARVKDETKQFADVQLESAEALRSQTAEQLQAYDEQLAGAKRFYIALAAEARIAGDAIALADAKAKLAAVEVEIGAVNAQLAATSKVGADAASGLSEGATKIAAALGEVSNDAKAASELIKRAFEGFDFNKGVQEIGDFAQGFDAVAARGERAAETLDATLLESLKKLSGADLLKFQSAATAAIESVGSAGLSTSATLKATLEAALERLGVKAEDTGQKITKSGADIIATFTAVAENAQASAQTIAAAFDAALAGTKTKEEAEALGAALEAAAQRGLVGVKELAAAHRDLEEKIRSVTASVSPLASQFELLGIKSQRQLEATRDNAREAFQAVVQGAREGVAAQEDVIRAFKVYAEAARAAAAESSESNRAQVESQLEVQASALGIADALEKAGIIGKKSGQDIAKGFDDAKQAAEDAGAAIEDAGKAAKGAADGQKGYTTALQGTQAAMQGIVAIGPEQAAALKLLNERLSQSAQLTNLSLDEAKYLLSTLGPLAGGAAGLIERRIQELTEAASKAEAAANRMKDEATDLQDQIDQLLGNDLSIEDRRHAKKLADLEAEARANGTLNSAEYRQLIDLENKLHALKMANIRKEKGGGGPTGDNPQTGASGGSPEGPAPAPAPAPRPEGGGGGGGVGVSSGRGVQIHVNVQGSVIGGTKEEIGETLARLVRPQLIRIEKRTGT